jgi:hypothetical protein
MESKVFELVHDLSDNYAEIVKHADRGLYLKVIPENRVKERYPSDEMVFVAIHYARGMRGSTLKEFSKETHLQVLNLHSGKQVLWDSQLLVDAVNYYCTVHLGRAYDQLSVHMNGRLLPFEDDNSFVNG